MRPIGAYDCARLHMAGEALLIVEFGDKLDARINDAVLAFDRILQEHGLAGLLESAPTNKSVALRFDPLLVPPDEFRLSVQRFLGTRDWFSSAVQSKPKRWRMAVCYGGQSGPDLSRLASMLDMPEEGLVRAHRSIIQRVFMVGFAPGFLYTGMLPDIFNIPRLQEIKPLVPAGSVSVAVGQSVISSTPAPTGWHTIGRTPLLNFAPEHQPPFLISAGDEIEFYEIDQAEFDEMRQEST